MCGRCNRAGKQAVLVISILCGNAGRGWSNACFPGSDCLLAMLGGIFIPHISRVFGMLGQLHLLLVSYGRRASLAAMNILQTAPISSNMIMVQKCSVPRSRIATARISAPHNEGLDISYEVSFFIITMF